MRLDIAQEEWPGEPAERHVKRTGSASMWTDVSTVYACCWGPDVVELSKHHESSGGVLAFTGTVRALALLNCSNSGHRSNCRDSQAPCLQVLCEVQKAVVPVSSIERALVLVTCVHRKVSKARKPGDSNAHGKSSR